MVGLVLVSHSAELAAAVKALAEQQTQGHAAIAAVGGTGDPAYPFGTDALAILAAIESVYDDAGVLVLMDLGSALMSAETALELMDPAQAARVRLCPAPFVEGAMAAAVQASIGRPLEAVAAEAVEALHPKQTSLAADTSPAPQPEIAPTSVQEIIATATIINPAGLHFGPAVQCVQLAARFSAVIALRNLTNRAVADGKRFNQVMALGAEQGHSVEISATGADAAVAAPALAALLASGFGETTSLQVAPTTETAPATPSGHGRVVLSGIAASSGVAAGVAVLLHGDAAPSPRYACADSEAEWQRYLAVTAEVQQALLSLAERLGRELGEAQSRIFQAHALLLDDDDLRARVQALIAQQHLNAEAALNDVFEAEAQRLAAMPSPRFQERATDLRDLAARLLRALHPESAASTAPVLPQNAIVVADDLTPSQTAGLDRERVAGFVTALGGATSHSAILARSMGIPAVVGAGIEALTQITADMPLAVDGTRGVLILDPDTATVTAFQAQRQADGAARQVAQAAAQGLAHSADGARVKVMANLATAAEVAAALRAGAEGVGLLRTEFLFQQRSEPPTEDEQTAMYTQVVQAMQGRPVIIRTLDIGGDKPAPYLQLPAESNPFLGWRAVRISLAMPDFFKVQLRAILRAAAHGPVQVMFPMIATVDEVVQARRLLREAAVDLAQHGFAPVAELPTGIMVEVPSAAVLADQLAPLVDFFSIGSNDLTQYTFAADRGNARVAGIGDALHPAVLRQVGQIITAAHAEGKWVGLCGELAGRPEAIPLLLGLGLDEFSMAPTAIPAAKTLLAQWSLAAARTLAQQALSLPSAQAVADLVRSARPA